MPQSTKLQRLTALAVPALLAANAMVLVLGVSVMDDAKPASADGTETVTYIKAADGTLRLVDPTTPEGAKAIADANQRGEHVVTGAEGDEPTELQQQAEVRQQGPTTTPVAPGLTDPIDDLLDQTESTIVKTVDQLGETVDGVVDDLTDVIDDAAGTDLGETVDPAVDDGTDTLTTTVSTVAGDARGTATTVVDAVTPTPAAPAPVPEPVADVVPDNAPVVAEDGPLGL